MKTRMLITGASGFIGRNLFEYFSQKENMEVFGIYKSRPCVSSNHMYYGNLTREEVVRNLFKEVKPHVLIHAAAATVGYREFKKNEGVFIHDNVMMNTNVIALAAEYAIPHAMLFGCAFVYPTVDRIVKEENAIEVPLDHPYHGGAKVKSVMEDLAHTYARLSGGRTVYTVIRHSNIYGPYDKFAGGGHVIAAKIAEVVNAPDSGIITVRGAGWEKRDLLHVDDLTRFIDLALSRDVLQTDVWNVGYGKSFSVNDIVQEIVAASGKRLVVKNDLSIPLTPTQPALTCQKAKNAFDWEPKIKLEEGLRMTMEWYKANKNLM